MNVTKGRIRYGKDSQIAETILPMNNLDGNMMKEEDANMHGAELKKHVELEINYTDT